jgi:hypothetical protein
MWIMFSIVMAAPSEDAAQRDIDNITQVMRDRIREAYREHHDMVKAQRPHQAVIASGASRRCGEHQTSIPVEPTMDSGAPQNTPPPLWKTHRRPPQG